MDGSLASRSGRYGVLMVPPTNTNRVRKSGGVRTREPVEGGCRTHGERGGFPHSFPGGTPCILRNVNSRPTRRSTCTSALVAAPQILKTRRRTIREQGEEAGQGHTAPEGCSPEAGGEDSGDGRAWRPSNRDRRKEFQSRACGGRNHGEDTFRRRTRKALGARRG